MPVCPTAIPACTAALPASTARSTFNAPCRPGLGCAPSAADRSSAKAAASNASSSAATSGSAHELRHPTRKRVWDGVSGQFLAKVAQRPPQIDPRAVLIARQHATALATVHPFRKRLFRDLPAVRAPLRGLEASSGVSKYSDPASSAFYRSICDRFRVTWRESRDSNPPFEPRSCLALRLFADLNIRSTSRLSVASSTTRAR